MRLLSQFAFGDEVLAAFGAPLMSFYLILDDVSTKATTHFTSAIAYRKKSMESLKKFVV